VAGGNYKKVTTFSALGVAVMSHSALAAGLRHLRNVVAAQHYHEDSDVQLMHVFATHRDETAFAALVRRHGPMVLRVCRRVLGHEQDAEDAFQATFLVLAQSAASLRKKASLASFLHGTAYRLALCAKRAAARRRKHEGRAPLRPSANPADDLSWREVRALVDEEIARLPEIYRSAFILCCLEDLSRAEAAQRLGVNENTLSSRLAEARKRLSQRLARRGVGLTAVLSALALALQSASALPAGLMATTIKTALATATGEGLTGIASASVITLVQSATSAMMASKVKIAMALLLSVSVLSGAGMWAYRGLAANALMLPAQPAEPRVAKVDDKPKTGPSKHAVAKTLEIQGRVLDPEGKPKAGAKLLLLDKETIAEIGATAADGRFTLSVPKNGYLIARTNDAGIEFIELPQVKPGNPVELRLVKDYAIRGRIVNTEGKPVPGVRIGIRAIIDNTDNQLDAFLISRKNRDMGGRFFGARYLWNEAAVIRAAATDADGRFTIHGVGANRLVYLRLSGTGIAEEELWIVNREGFDPKEYNQTPINSPYGVPKRLHPPEGRELGLLFGPDASVIVEAEKPIHGVVTDADSGKGRPNVVVYLSSPGNAPIPVPLQAATDAQGRYEIHGCRKSQSYTLEVTSDGETGYMACQVHVADTAGYQPLRADIRIKKGVVVTGKVIERATGKSVPGFAETGVLRDNPFVKKYPTFNASALGRGNRVNTSAHGAFRIVTIPGPTLLMGGYYTPEAEKFDYIEFAKYRPPAADPEYPRYFQNLPGSRRDAPGYLSYGGGIGLIQGNYCKVLDIKPGTAAVHQDIFLDLASVLEVKIQDTGGHPVVGVWGTDFPTDSFIGPLEIERAICPVYGLEMRKPRLLIFYEPKKKIIGSRKLQGGEKGPLVVTLGGMGAIKGRLLDAESKPLAGVVVTAVYRESEAEKMHQLIHAAKQVVTDAAGAFTLDELIPDLKFDLSIHRGKRRFERETKSDEATIQVKPGECRSLGDIRAKPFSREP
jgi:RNA polymerase sigma factor (sigma-70 family)